MRRFYTVFTGFVATAFLFTLALGNAPKSNAEDGGAQLKVVATVGMIGDITKRIGGDRVAVQVLMGSGVDPHLYQPTPNDMLKLIKADIIFFGGLHLEGRMIEVLEKYSTQKPCFAVSAAIPESRLVRVAANTDGMQFDPHIWMDVKLWQEAVRLVAAKLTDLEKGSAATFTKNRDALLEELTRLDEFVRQIMISIPADQRVLVTAHDAFHYFGKAYQVEVRGIQGVSTSSEAGLKDINDLVDFLVARKIRAIFVETSVSQKNVLALIEGTQAKGHNVVIGGELFSDSLGPASGPGGTYVGMISQNALTVGKALGAKLPAERFADFTAQSTGAQSTGAQSTGIKSVGAQAN